MAANSSRGRRVPGPPEVVGELVEPLHLARQLDVGDVLAGHLRQARRWRAVVAVVSVVMRSLVTRDVRRRLHSTRRDRSRGRRGPQPPTPGSAASPSPGEQLVEAVAVQAEALARVVGGGADGDQERPVGGGEQQQLGESARRALRRQRRAARRRRRPRRGEVSPEPGRWRRSPTRGGRRSSPHEPSATKRAAGSVRGAARGSASSCVTGPPARQLPSTSSSQATPSNHQWPNSSAS